MDLSAAQKSVLLKTALFKDIGQSGYEALLDCLDVRKASAQKGESILRAGENARFFGLLLSGSAQVMREDIAGNRHILAALEPGDVFGESFAAAEAPALPVSVVAAESSASLLFRYARIVRGCENACAMHDRLLKNFISILAEKNLLLNQKLSYLSKRTLREKLLAYLFEQAERQGGRYFTIPFNRQELADFLVADRSALSSELSKLRQEGVLEFYKNEFKLTLNRKGSV